MKLVKHGLKAAVLLAITSASLSTQAHTIRIGWSKPEPASLALIAMGLIGLGWSRRKRC